ncbi:hypothetical protein HML84_12885 [Alcanivorax sp. IO_7]|nr:hypothetical protein HML84_12885 [Alcanivorax sp. IO_7]
MLIDQSSAAQTFWPWLKMKYGYTESMRRPYTFSVAPFLNDDRMCQQGYLGASRLISRRPALTPAFFCWPIKDIPLCANHRHPG